MSNYRDNCLKSLPNIDQLNKETVECNLDIIYSVKVENLTESERNRQDIPEYYVVYRSSTADGGVVVYGYSSNKKEWYCNPSLRWLVKYLIEKRVEDRDIIRTITEQLEGTF